MIPTCTPKEIGQGTPLSLDNNGNIMGETGGIATIDLKGLLADSNYHNGLYHNVSSGEMPMGLSLSTEGIISIDDATSIPCSSNLVEVNIVNGWGLMSTLPLCISIMDNALVDPPIANGTVPALTGLTTTSETVNMSSYFGGGDSTLSVTSDPVSNASISGTTLTIVPNNRGSTYTVVVTATNASGTATQSISVTESAPPSVGNVKPVFFANTVDVTATSLTCGSYVAAGFDPVMDTSVYPLAETFELDLNDLVTQGTGITWSKLLINEEGQGAPFQTFYGNPAVHDLNGSVLWSKWIPTVYVVRATNSEGYTDITINLRTDVSGEWQW